MEKPIAEACLRNQEPIAAALEQLLTQPARVLELGSGTGQHAVYVGRRLPHLTWQPTELPEALPGIRAWLADSGLTNVLAPLALDVRAREWPVTGPFDAVFTANTLHFVGWAVVEALFAGVEKVLRGGGIFCAYGPFNEDQQYTSEGNRQLDLWLQSRDPDSGIKDRQDIMDRAAEYGLIFEQDVAMPANNRILVFRRSEASDRSNG